MMVDPTSVPLPSEATAAGGKAKLFSNIADGVQDDSLFRIKSAFDKEADLAPGRSDIPLSSSSGQKTLNSPPPPSAPGMMPSEGVQRPLVGIVNDDDESPMDQVMDRLGGLGETANRAISTIVAIDFFIVLFFLGWLVVSVGYQFAVCGELTPPEAMDAGAAVCANPVYESWYALWTPVVQPLLGILFLGTIAQATINSISGSGKEEGRK